MYRPDSKLASLNVLEGLERGISNETTLHSKGVHSGAAGKTFSEELFLE